VTTSAPDLSVVIPSVNGLGMLVECLDALQAAEGGAWLEVLVVDRCGDAVRREVHRRFPEAVVIPTAPDATIPAMRAIGFRHARAAAVAVIEDHVLVPAGWAGQMLDALAAGSDVVGGSVVNAATGRIVDWAAFLCEYSQVLPPGPAGRIEILAGNNVVYRRAVLERYAAAIDEGRWEDHLHQAMRRDGVRIRCHPEIVVDHKRHYTVSEYLAQRYLYARAYAGLRSVQMTTARRAAAGVSRLALPPVLLSRIVSRALAAGCPRAALAGSLLLLPLFVCAWAAGEVVGYAAGPGNALSRVR
jgi:glycosyltransferase involved in cell wall biosynthesis